MHKSSCTNKIITELRGGGFRSVGDLEVKVDLQQIITELRRGGAVAAAPAQRLQLFGILPLVFFQLLVSPSDLLSPPLVLCCPGHQGTAASFDPDAGASFDPDASAGRILGRTWTPRAVRQRNFALFGGDFLMQQVRPRAPRH